ncbi:MAG: hypothetical protein M5U28_18050 [Sandaracinaceae bacterium]|nr:hypothetical protein [Sandaracinaceae bacterium]
MRAQLAQLPAGEPRGRSASVARLAIARPSSGALAKRRTTRSLRVSRASTANGSLAVKRRST